MLSEFSLDSLSAFLRWSPVVQFYPSEGLPNHPIDRNELHLVVTGQLPTHSVLYGQTMNFSPECCDPIFRYRMFKDKLLIERLPVQIGERINIAHVEQKQAPYSFCMHS